MEASRACFLVLLPELCVYSSQEVPWLLPHMVNLKLFGGPDYPKHGPSLKVKVMLLPAQKKREAGAWKLTQCDESHQV